MYFRMELRRSYFAREGPTPRDSCKDAPSIVVEELSSTEIGLGEH